MRLRFQLFPVRFAKTATSSTPSSTAASPDTGHTRRVTEPLAEAAQEDAVDEKVDGRRDEFEDSAELLDEEGNRRAALRSVIQNDLDALGWNVTNDEDEYNDDHDQCNALFA